MIVGLLVIIWAAAFIDRKYGVWVLMFLSIVMFLVGGGFAPTVFSMIALVTAAMINRPLTWWRKHFPHGLRDFLARLWKWSLVALVFLSLFLVELATFGYPLMLFFSADKILNLCRSLGNITFYGLGPVVILTALAYDIQKQTD